ncbi:lipoyltransferase and lipoate-protein ligase [Lichtheimia corymbifera JMRC:FSU:9682]|uniref:Putative lipoate-protein ligase A n=1 Tax=Lichtheimia corymbifera JMRC:FSU:9682 TaxID=1263082 RepID=A0A068SBM5_9FUNG|nr:lipoyltransferase and lipoate-protein ligase [Lichtheimia corymbifera JMRC:FSU:9682]
MFTRRSHVLLGSATHHMRRQWSIQPMSRSMSTASNKVECYISKINDPYINLSIEEWLLRDTDPEKYILYLWRNRPCVVIGRNQNPFLECNLGFMQEHNIPLVRRRSGGGAVYHDMGNSIYTIFMPREAFSRRVNAELVSRALEELDIPAYVNDRHDIAVDGFKVSGSAYKIINKRAYHHGTMLIDADTATLKGCLSKKGKTGIVSKGVESVPSPVTNLREYSYTIDHQQFCESVLNEFTYDYNGGLDVEPIVFDESHVDSLPQRVHDMRKELQTWDWIYGQTPEFTNEMKTDFDWGHVDGLIRCRHGIITEAELTSDATGAHPVTVLAALSNALIGCRYSEQPVNAAIAKIQNNVPGLMNPENQSMVHQLVEWLSSRLK